MIWEFKGRKKGWSVSMWLGQLCWSKVSVFYRNVDSDLFLFFLFFFFFKDRVSLCISG
jgi:hypothetical protein